MEILNQKKLTAHQKKQVFDLWNTEYPASICHKNIDGLEEYLSKLKNPKHTLIVDKNELLAWYCDFERDSERNFAMIVSRQAQGLGIGTKLLNLAKSINNSLFGWVVIGDGYKKIDGSEYPSPVGFYEKNGFEILFDQTWESDVLKTVKIRWGNKE